MTLNAQERAAVEAAKTWRGLANEPMRWQEAVTPMHDNHRVYATGHLSGFRAGVEAAIKVVKHYEHLENELRALLAQEAGK